MVGYLKSPLFSTKYGGNRPTGFEELLKLNFQNNVLSHILLL
ncbi:uncharacterized protein METZ01_LOCUS13713 [marine metagenome]|uniref:Uncharacterized protein n=1 Tax=marine metagenome TaxID=408172 RepID=A0A381P3H0_9ZZZZ